MDVLYTDFSKAFDKVSHKKLLHKMRAYGIVGKMWKWIEVFLSDRKQCVVLGDTESSIVISSVPQGSVLGTILFTIFINDLPECLINECEMYADDNKVMAENEMQIMADNVDGQENGLQEDINTILTRTYTYLSIHIELH